MSVPLTKAELAKMIDHTLLKATATEEQIIKLCEEAKEYSFASVCVNPRFVSCAAARLSDSSVKVCTVVGFPLGANATHVKVLEAEHAVFSGADEVDMVCDIGAVLGGCLDAVASDIKKVVVASKDAGRKVGRNIVVKVIIETCYLSDEQIKAVTKIVCESGADFVKTSTGFGTGGATVKAVSLMKESIDEYFASMPCKKGEEEKTQIKAAGGIKKLDFALELIKAGATRIGASSGAEIIAEFETSLVAPIS